MKKLTSIMPLIFTAIGAAVIIPLGVYRLFFSLPVNDKIIGITASAIYLIWMFSEMCYISFKEVKKSEDTKDHQTMEFAGTVKTALLILAFAATRRIDIILGLIGIAVMIIGIFIRLTAVIKLGKYYSHRIREIEHLVSDGIYRVIRHPAYLGTLIAHIGVVLVFLNIFTLIALMFWCFVVWLRTHMEDKFLLESKEYKEYANIVKCKLFPMIW